MTVNTVKQTKNIYYKLTGILIMLTLLLTGCSGGSAKDHDTVVWIGDSLTQGSLGDIDDNLANAPYVTLSQLTGLKVEGFGYYGYNTHDIMWCYRDETQANQTVDPSKVYVFWVGANDWVHDGIVSTEVDGVNAEVDAILAKGVEDYIVIGTIARKELREKIDNRIAYEIINDKLEEKYGEHYMDVIDIITETGYGPDDVHLRQEAYDRVAGAVRDKLKSLKYIR